MSARTFRGLRNLAGRITPWLVDVGSWIFGGLTAANLVVLSALITVGPVDAAIRTSTAAVAAALPLNVAGIILLRLIKDANEIAAVSVALTAIAIAAAVWHMGHLIALVLLSAVILSAGIVTVAIAHALPPESAAEESLKLRYRERRLEGANRQRR